MHQKVKPTKVCGSLRMSSRAIQTSQTEQDDQHAAFLIQDETSFVFPTNTPSYFVCPSPPNLKEVYLYCGTLRLACSIFQRLPPLPLPSTPQEARFTHTAES